MTFEHLKGDRKSECSIRINDQWRICFRFENGNVYDAGIEDYVMLQMELEIPKFRIE